MSCISIMKNYGLFNIILFSSLSHAKVNLELNQLVEQNGTQVFKIENSHYLDKVIVNPDLNEKMYFLKKNAYEKSDEMVFSTISFNEDGGNRFKEIVPRVNKNNVIRVITEFPDRGIFRIFYDIGYDDGEWFLNRVSYETHHWQDTPDMMTYCYQDTKVNLDKLNEDNWFDAVRPFSKNWDKTKVTCEDSATLSSYANVYQINAKHHLFDKPTLNSKSKMYLIKGDKVNLLQRQNEFYQIEYQSAKKGILRKWIHCSAIEAC